MLSKLVKVLYWIVHLTKFHYESVTYLKVIGDGEKSGKCDDWSDGMFPLQTTLDEFAQVDELHDDRFDAHHVVQEDLKFKKWTIKNESQKF